MSMCQELQMVGVSSQSWERAAAAAIKQAIESFNDHCIMRRVNESGFPAPMFTTEIVKFDVMLNDKGEIERYRTTVKVSFLPAAAESSARLRAPVGR